MRSISIQVQLDRAPYPDVRKVRQLFEKLKTGSLVEASHFDEGKDKGRYMNFTYGSNNAQALWSVIRKEVYEENKVGNTLLNCSIAMCSSETGWDDCILLHHFDPSVPLESFNKL